MNKLNDQTAHAVMMVRPASFGFNEQTTWSNVFQERPSKVTDINDIVKREFDELVEKLKQKKIKVIVLDDTITPNKPDAVFCNNWISFHHDGTVIFYPMMASNRRVERRGDVMEKLRDHGFQINRVIDYSKFEDTDKFLESTGSMVIDYVNNIIYACSSPRTDPEVLKVVAGQLHMEIEAFTAVDRDGRKIYHTNVMMTVGDRFAIICNDAIKDVHEKNRILTKLSTTSHEIISITYDQLYNFAGNMLQIKSSDGNNLLAMSETAYKSLSQHQISTIEKYADILVARIPTIEKYGGGSIRCMMANIHLPKSPTK